MTTEVDICNRSLLKAGREKVISSLTQDSVEARACNTAYANNRNSILRMAPWNCAMMTANLVYITSQPGTQENTSAATTLWAPGQPRPPWGYEYQYPADCLKPCWIVPASQTGFTGVPITTAVTGSAANTWLGGPIVFKVGTDLFLSATAVSPIAAGIGYAVGDIVTLSLDPVTVTKINKIGTFLAGSPQGAPVKVQVATIDGAGGIVTCSIIPQVIDSSPPIGGSYFYTYTNTPTAASTTGSGTGATFSTDIGSSIPQSQRVILTNQEFATLVYVRQVSDPNIWDDLFQDAITDALAADLCLVLTGDKELTNILRQSTNATIAEARKADGNEGLTINDVTPDWIRCRGIDFDSQYLGSGFDWGGMLPLFD